MQKLKLVATLFAFEANESEFAAKQALNTYEQLLSSEMSAIDDPTNLKEVSSHRVVVSAVSSLSKHSRSYVEQLVGSVLTIARIRRGIISFTCMGIVGTRKCGKTTVMREVFGQEAAKPSPTQNTKIVTAYSLSDNFVGIDYPGLDDTNRGTFDQVKKALPIAMCFLVVVNATKFGDRDKEVLLQVLSNAAPFVLLLNQRTLSFASWRLIPAVLQTHSKTS